CSPAMARSKRPHGYVRMSTTETFPTAPRRGIDPYKLGHGQNGDGGGRDYATGLGEGGPASSRVITGYGFWIFLLSDIIMFSCFFAAFAVLRSATAGGPTQSAIVEPWRVAAETGFLL